MTLHAHPTDTLSYACGCVSRHQSPSVLVPALRTVGNIVTGDDMQTQIIINCGALPCLLNLLQTTHKKSIKKEACWTLSNITAGTKDQIQAVFDAGIIPPLVHLLATAEFDIKKESAWAISNATSGGTREQIKYLVSAGCIRPLCDLLTCTDTRIVSIALEGLENILKVMTIVSISSQVWVSECNQCTEELQGLGCLHHSLCVMRLGNHNCFLCYCIKAMTCAGHSMPD